MSRTSLVAAGHAALLCRNWAATVQFYGEALAAGADDLPFSATCLAYRSSALLELGRINEALADAERSVVFAPTLADAHLRAAAAAFALSKQRASSQYSDPEPPDLFFVPMARRAMVAAALAVHFGADLFASPTISAVLEKFSSTVIPLAGKYDFRLVPSIPRPSSHKSSMVVLLLGPGEYDALGLERLVCWNGHDIVCLVGAGAEATCIVRGTGLASSSLLHFAGSRTIFHLQDLTLKNSEPVGHLLLTEQCKEPVTVLRCTFRGSLAPLQSLPYEWSLTGGPCYVAANPLLCVDRDSTVVASHCLFELAEGGAALACSAGADLRLAHCEARYCSSSLEVRARASATAVNCTFHHCRQGVLAWESFRSFHLRRTTVSDHAKEGILVKDSEDGAPRSLIEGSRFFRNRSFGISLDGAASVTMDGISVFANNFWGISVKSMCGLSLAHSRVVENRCGGITIGFNYSAEVSISDTLIARNCGPGLQNVAAGSGSQAAILNRMPEATKREFGMPVGETRIYSRPPLLVRLVQEHNDERPLHPRLRQRQSQCSHCGSEETKLSSCAMCLSVAYCSRACQRLHWGVHQLLCKKLSGEVSVVVKKTALPGHLFPHPKIAETAAAKAKAAKPPAPGTRLIFKVQTPDSLSPYPLQPLVIYDKSRICPGEFSDARIFDFVIENGVLCANVHLAKKIFLYGVLEETTNSIRLFLDPLAPFQDW